MEQKTSLIHDELICEVLARRSVGLIFKVPSIQDVLCGLYSQFDLLSVLIS